MPCVKVQKMYLTTFIGDTTIILAQFQNDLGFMIKQDVLEHEDDVSSIGLPNL